MRFDFVKRIKLDKCLLFFSGGKDSIISLDLLKTHADIKELKAVYLYYVPDMKYKKDIFDFYSKKYNIEIIQIPHPDFISYQQNKVYGMKNNLNRKYTKTELKLGNYQKQVKKDLDFIWGALGYKKTDSVTRARQLYKYSEIDEHNNFIYPVAYFNDRDIFYYIKKKKLKLPVEYQHNFKNEITTPFSKDILLFLKYNYKCDYEKILNTFPQLESIFLS